MSNFSTFAMITEGNISTAPNMFVASTPDSLATILVAGYLNDIRHKIKLNDLITINYLDTSVFPLDVGEVAVLGSFRVNFDPNTQDWNLLATAATPSGIAAIGVHSAKFTNAGGSATTTIIDGNINPNMIVLARWATSGTAAIVETVVAGVGSLVVVSNTDPGASILSYIAFVPSSALQAQGVYPASYSYSGGSATITIANANITANMVVEANFISETNAAYIEKVTVAAGSLTILCNTNPGASVIGYVATVPSASLTAAGLYAALYANAGGSATTSITDATITAKSVVVASWNTSANAVAINKVTPSAGTLTILSSGDPGASVLSYTATPNSLGGETDNYLISTNNLSDVASAATSLSNLGGVPLAGGQLTGTVRTTKGTGTESTNAVTISPLASQSGVITTSALTTASGSTYTIAVTNSAVAASSVILLSRMGGTNTIGFSMSAVYTSAGLWTITLKNTDVAAVALNGTVILGFEIL